MTTISWNNSYSLCNEQIDKQHEKLMDLTQRLNHVTVEEQGAGLLNEILAEIVNYMREHFHDEENLMEQIKYPQLKEHRAMHDAFVSKVADLCNRFMEGDLSIFDELKLFLNNWIELHTTSADMELKAFLS